MSALTDVAASNEIPDELKKFVMETVGGLFWNWYHVHANDRILSVGWWIIKKTVRVKDLYSVFVMLFGSEPQKVI